MQPAGDFDTGRDSWKENPILNLGDGRDGRKKRNELMLNRFQGLLRQCEKINERECMNNLILSEKRFTFFQHFTERYRHVDDMSQLIEKETHIKVAECRFEKKHETIRTEFACTFYSRNSANMLQKQLSC